MENWRIGFYGKLENWLLRKIIELAFTEKLENWLLRKNWRIGFYGKIEELAFTENWCKIRVIIKSWIEKSQVNRWKKPSESLKKANWCVKKPIDVLKSQLMRWKANWCVEKPIEFVEKPIEFVEKPIDALKSQLMRWKANWCVEKPIDALKSQLIAWKIVVKSPKAIVVLLFLSCI